MLDIKIIKSPTQNTINLIQSRTRKENRLVMEKLEDRIGAVALVQGRLNEVFWAADCVEKAAPVAVAEVMGLCPQHLACIAVFGSASAVETAIDTLEGMEQRGN